MCTLALRCSKRFDLVCTQDEDALREMTRRFAVDTLQPLVRQMDEEQKMDPDLLRQCFEHGWTVSQKMPLR